MKDWPSWVRDHPGMEDWIEAGEDGSDPFEIPAQSTDWLIFSEQQYNRLVDHLETHFRHPDAVAQSIEIDAARYLERTADTSTPNERRKWMRRYESLAERAWQQLMTYHHRGAAPHHRGWRKTLQVYVRLKETVEYNKSPKGNQRRTARDDLILAIYDAYGRPPITRDNHFEQTVSLVLELLEGSPTDIHKTILTALKRDPNPTRND